MFDVTPLATGPINQSGYTIEVVLAQPATILASSTDKSPVTQQAAGMIAAGSGHAMTLRTLRQPDQTVLKSGWGNGAEEDKMVVLMTQDFAGGNREIAEAVSNDMDVRENPPTGLIAHVLTDIPGGIRAVDIW
jgi:hypothetical protein